MSESSSHSDCRTRLLRLLIADDNAVARASLRNLLEDAPGVAIVGEAASGGEGVAEALRLKPDVVLLDIRMPDLDGLQVTAELRAQLPSTRVIIISMLSHWAMVSATIQAGACGYLLKDTSRAELLAAVRLVSEGAVYITPELTCALERA